MKYYGIIGTPLSHSFSAEFWNTKFQNEHLDAKYMVWDIDASEIETILYQSDVHGINITYPYKESIISYLNAIDPIAQEIGSVNCIARYTHLGDNAWKGYNTDWIGFTVAINVRIKHYLANNIKPQALLLGTGGAAKAVKYALKQMAIPTLMVSHSGKGDLSYEDLTYEHIQQHQIIIHCTPLGMHPNTETCVDFPFEYLTPIHTAFDCIYNPDETVFLRKSRQQGTTTINGLSMLQSQALAAWDIWQAY